MNPSTPHGLGATTGTDLDDLTLQVAEERLDCQSASKRGSGANLVLIGNLFHPG